MIVSPYVPYFVPQTEGILFINHKSKIPVGASHSTYQRRTLPRLSIFVDVESLPQQYIDACSTDLFSQKVIPKPPNYLVEVMYKNGELDEFNQITDIENSAKYAQRDEFLMRCEFQLEGEFFEAGGYEAPLFRISKVVDFKKSESFLEQIWADLENTHEKKRDQ